MISSSFLIDRCLLIKGEIFSTNLASGKFLSIASDFATVKLSFSTAHFLGFPANALMCDLISANASS